MMFAEFQKGDRVYVKTFRQQGKVVQVKSNFCVVHLDNGAEISPHKMDLVIVTEDNAEPYNPVKMLAEFHKAFKYKRSDNPVALSADEVFKRIVFIQEELIELLAASVETVEEFSQYAYELEEKKQEAYNKEVGKVGVYTDEERIVNQTDALVDLLVFVYGTADMSGVDLRVPMRIVMKANMSKLDDNGEPIYNEFGKIQKSKNFTPPEPMIEKEIKNQIKAAENK